MVAPSQARGLKQNDHIKVMGFLGRAFTGAWIETIQPSRLGICIKSRAFTGAWIETQEGDMINSQIVVAPSQARGLKPLCLAPHMQLNRSRLHRRVD